MDTSYNPYLFYCFMRDGILFAHDNGQPRQIGVSDQIYNDLLQQYNDIGATATEYRDKLVELGIIKPELTQEQIIQEQSNQIAEMRKTLDQTTNINKQLLDFLNKNKAVEDGYTEDTGVCNQGDTEGDATGATVQRKQGRNTKGTS